MYKNELFIIFLSKIILFHSPPDTIAEINDWLPPSFIQYLLNEDHMHLFSFQSALTLSNNFQVSTSTPLIFIFSISGIMCLSF